MREFAGQLRRLIDHSGLSVAAVADRTGYSKTSWERYLNGRLLAPEGAIVALAEVTGTDQAHLATMWELAERAWSRSEMRHGLTMEDIRVAQARAALGEFGPNPLGDDRSRRFGGRTTGTAVDEGAGAGGGGRPPSVPIQRGNAPRAPQPADRRRLTLVLTGVVGALLVLAAAVLLTDPGGDDKGGKAPAAPSSTPARTRTPQWSP
ncbi:helix-turn-helix transcriptional regulator [Streptomyces sp. NPDC048411]|uniref:helix-turn-helix domain-containing protein n=1 Tax=Streptomyces sp. NPDC048411 TaxID=3157206 RepID=UPI00345153FA